MLVGGSPKRLDAFQMFHNSLPSIVAAVLVAYGQGVHGFVLPTATVNYEYFIVSKNKKIRIIYLHKQNILSKNNITSSSCAIPETGFGSSPHIPVLIVCFSCFYTGIWDLLFNAGSEWLLER